MQKDPVVVLTLFVSALFGLIAYFILHTMGGSNAFLLAVLGALIFALLLLPVLRLLLAREDRKYKQLEALLPEPAFFTANGNFTMGGKPRNGNFYFCPSGIVCITLDAKPYYYCQFLWNSIVDCSSDPAHLLLKLDDGSIIPFTIPNAPEAEAQIRRQKLRLLEGH